MSQSKLLTLQGVSNLLGISRDTICGMARDNLLVPPIIHMPIRRWSEHQVLVSIGVASPDSPAIKVDRHGTWRWFVDGEFGNPIPNQFHESRDESAA